MEQIQSVKNAFIKKVRSLKQKKYRDETGLFLAEGDKCAKEALQAGRAEALLTTKEDHQLAIQAEREGIRTVFVPRLVMETVCEIKSPQEVLAVAKKAALPLPREGLFVALENVSDPQNVGTILRTADAVGAAGCFQGSARTILPQRRCEPPWAALSICLSKRRMIFPHAF